MTTRRQFLGRSGTPGAELGRTLNADGKTYRCTAGGPWTAQGTARLIDSATSPTKPGCKDHFIPLNLGNPRWLGASGMWDSF